VNERNHAANRTMSRICGALMITDLEHIASHT
jgi:hypothetical protein